MKPALCSALLALLVGCGDGAGGSVIDADAEAAGEDATSAEELACRDVAAGEPAENRQRIQACLDAPWGYAHLRAEVFAIDRGLVVDAGDVLAGPGPETRATIQPAVASARFELISNAILNVVNTGGGPLGGTQRNITLDLRDALFDGVATGNACNRDDYLHEGAGHDVRRNDGCPRY